MDNDEKISEHYTGTYEVGDSVVRFVLWYSSPAVDDGEPYIAAHGFLRSDGCVNVLFDESRGGLMTHFCSEKDIEEFSGALRWVWSLD